MAKIALDDELAALELMALAQLRVKWSDLTGRPVPKISAAMLRMALAWEMQAQSPWRPVPTDAAEARSACRGQD